MQVKFFEEKPIQKATNTMVIHEEINNQFVFEEAKPIFKAFIFGHILDIFFDVRTGTRKVIKYKAFKRELRSRMGCIVKDEISIIVDALITEGYLKKDPENVMDPRCKLITENLLLRSLF